MTGLIQGPESTVYRCSLPGLAGFTAPSPWGPVITLPRGGARALRMAERKGFEPLVRCRTHDFQSCTFVHSVTSPIHPQRANLEDRIHLEGCFERSKWSLATPRMAERVGFEPTVALTTFDFESNAFVHSATSPKVLGPLTLNPGDCSPWPPVSERVAERKSLAARCCTLPP